MNGHKALIALRQAGKRPRAVWIADTDERIDRMVSTDWHQERNCSDGAWHAHIQLTADDLPETADFRALRGLVVHVRSNRGPGRFQRLCRAILEAGADHVIGVNDEKVFSFKVAQ